MQPAIHDTIQFDCLYCEEILTVPIALAGVRGPCPVCHQEITAPFVHRPQPSRITARVQLPAPCTLIPEEATTAEVTAELAEGGWFDEQHASAVGILVPALRTPWRGWRRTADLAIITAFTGSSLTVAASLKYADSSTLTQSLPENLAELVALEQRAMENRRDEAGVLASASVGQFLRAGDGENASRLLMTVGEASLPDLGYPAFSNVVPEQLRSLNQRRIPGTERFVTTLTTNPEIGPYFIVEETAHGPRIHYEPLVQQAGRLFEQFTTGGYGATATLYATVCPCPGNDETEFRAKRPDLASFQLVSVVSAFPALEGQNAFVACLAKGGKAARQFSRRAHDGGWRPAVVKVEQRRHPESGPYIEIIEFVPNVWSREIAD